MNEKKSDLIKKVDDAGNIMLSESGDFVYWPKGMAGFLNSWSLREIADELDRRTKKAFEGNDDDRERQEP